MADLAATTAERLETGATGSGIMIVDGEQEPVGAARVARSSAPGYPVALFGLAHGLHPELRPGELVVATEVRSTDGTPPRPLPSASLLANDLRHRGLHVRTGPIVCSPGDVSDETARELAAAGALAWDSESAWLALDLLDHPIAAVRAIAGTATGGSMDVELRALGTFLGVRASLEQWAQASGPHDVLLASPRSFCAGVERAIKIVERALERFGRPVYVRRQIVHNAHVVADLEARGAIFVAELEQVPDGATVVLAAHGVSPAVRSAAANRSDLTVIDATCPLVAKVHHEARRYLAQEYQIVLIGHAEHEEVVGTMGEAVDRIWLVQRPEDVAELPFDGRDQVGYLTQTTLSTDDTDEVIAALRRRFPRLVGPAANDICYATQNRQDAVRALAHHCDLMLIVGSTNSSNAARLVEVARREGCRAELIEDASGLRLGWLREVASVGLTAGASAPEALVTGVIDALGALGPATVTEHRTTEETVQFSLPRQVR